MSYNDGRALVHCVVSTKNQWPLIRKPENLCRYSVAFAYPENIQIFAAGGSNNHLHLLLSTDDDGLTDAVEYIKTHMASWLQETCPSFEWQTGYEAFAIRRAQREAVIEHIARQKEYHWRHDYQQEMAELREEARPVVRVAG